MELSLKVGEKVQYLVPQRLNLNAESLNTVLYFRSREVLGKCSLVMTVDGFEVLRKRYSVLRPPEMERVEFDFGSLGLTPQSKISFEIEEA